MVHGLKVIGQGVSLHRLRLCRRVQDTAILVRAAALSQITPARLVLIPMRSERPYLGVSHHI